ncbi:condensation domain-containing protein [Actinoplanes sp. NPDC049118]|uniref:condensation domain-containing protein n=1 Tax=Actinoplanes sp. NPDC049118 TaxID=3155769 RepID=UPI0033F9D23B
MKTLTARLASMSAEERGRFLAKVHTAATGTVVAQEPRLTPGSCPGGRGPASFVQEQLWFVSRLADGVPAYNVSFAFRLDGPLDADALGGAVADVAGRHDVLRTRLVVTGGRLDQEVTDRTPAMPLTDVSTADDPEQAAGELLGELSRTVFDLSAGPPLRLALLRIRDDRHVLAWISHHTLVDGWSFGIIGTELAAAYRGRRAGRPANLPPVRLQFLDVARWQRARVDGELLRDLVSGWRERLAGPEPRELPTDRPRPDRQTFRGGMRRFDLGGPAARAVTAAAENAGVTPFGVLLGAYALTLAAHAGGDAGVIGVPLAGRGRPELDGVVGPCSNTLPLRVDLAGDPTLAEVTARANEAMLAAVSGQDVPFGKLAEAVLPDRDASRNPLFDVLFNLGNLPPGSDRAELGPDTTMRIDGCPNGTVRLDLELTVEHGPDSLTGRLEYNAELFDDSTAGDLVDDLRHVLERIAGSPGERRSAVRPPGAARRRVAARARALRHDGAPATRSASAARRSNRWSR